VRKLIDFGRDLMATVQARETDAAPITIARRFGTLDAARIIARITRGLMIAAALELRLSRPVPCMGVRPTPPTPARRTSAPRKPRQPRIDEEAELLGALPSAKEIAARLRKRRPGAVIVEICRDLGIDYRHELWREIQDAITHHGGSLATVLRNVLRRGQAAAGLPWPPELEASYQRYLARLALPP